MARLSKSRTHAVVLENGHLLDVRFLWRLTDQDSGEQTLQEQAQLTPWYAYHRDVLVDLLVKAGLFVRFFDYDEKQWMENSIIGGYNRCPGSRDAQWSRPTLEEFDRDYLSII